MKPYATVRGKFKPEFFEGTDKRNNSAAHKEEVRNANRSLKKGVRQKHKRDIQRILEKL